MSPLICTTPPGRRRHTWLAPWKQISNLLTLASTQHGNTLRIENTGSTSWKPIRSSSGLAHDNETSLIGVIAHYHDFAQRSKTVGFGRMFVFSKLGKYKLSVNFILPHDSSKSKYSQYSQPATLLHCVRGYELLCPSCSGYCQMIKLTALMHS